MTRRRDLLRAAVGAGIAGLAGCPGQASDEQAEETVTDAGTPVSIEGEAPRWTTGAKYGVATVPDHASDDPSKVWATFTQGAVTEVRYPRIDLLNLRTLEFVVVGESEVWRTYETDRTTDDGVERSTTLATDDALVYEQTATPTDSDAWELTVEWVTDPARDALLGDVAFATDGDYDLYAVARTACSQSAGADVGQRTEVNGGYELAAWDGPGNDSQHVVTDADGDTYEVALGLATTDGFDRASALSNDDGQALHVRHRRQRQRSGQQPEGHA
jgi:hypothetical protein